MMAVYVCQEGIAGEFMLYDAPIQLFIKVDYKTWFNIPVVHCLWSATCKSQFIFFKNYCNFVTNEETQSVLQIKMK